MDLSNITINTQSSIRIEGKKILYFDPYKIGCSVNDADYIFITHEHPDHFECESIGKIINKNTILIAPLSMEKRIKEKAIISQNNCIFLSPNESANLDGITVKAVHAYNNIVPFHPKLKRWLGYVVTMDDTDYYIAGDTDDNEDNKKMSCDIAIIPVGGKYTMNAKQAAQFVLDIKPKAAIPSHYRPSVEKATAGTEFKTLVEAKSSNIQVEIKL